MSSRAFELYELSEERQLQQVHHLPHRLLESAFVVEIVQQRMMTTTTMMMMMMMMMMMRLLFGPVVHVLFLRRLLHLFLRRVPDIEGTVVEVENKGKIQREN